MGTWGIPNGCCQGMQDQAQAAPGVPGCGSWKTQAVPTWPRSPAISLTDVSCNEAAQIDTTLLQLILGICDVTRAQTCLLAFVLP